MFGVVRLVVATEVVGVADEDEDEREGECEGEGEATDVTVGVDSTLESTFLDEKRATTTINIIKNMIKYFGFIIISHYSMESS